MLAAVIMLAVTRAWVPPFSYRAGYVPPRDIVPAEDVHKVNKALTQKLELQASAQATFVYDQDRKPLENLREALFAKLAAIADAKDYERIEDEWLTFVTAEEKAKAKTIREANEKAWVEAVKKEKERAEKARAEEELRLDKEKAERKEKDDGEDPKETEDKDDKPDETKPDSAPAKPADEKKPADEAGVAKPPVEDRDDPTKPNLPPRPVDPLETTLRDFQKLIAGEDKLKAIQRSLRNAFVDIEQQGFFEKAEHDANEGNQAEITIQPLGDPTNQSRAKIPDLLLRR